MLLLFDFIFRPLIHLEDANFEEVVKFVDALQNVLGRLKLDDAPGDQQLVKLGNHEQFININDYFVPKAGLDQHLAHGVLLGVILNLVVLFLDALVGLIDEETEEGGEEEDLELLLVSVEFVSVILQHQTVHPAEGDAQQ